LFLNQFSSWIDEYRSMDMKEQIIKLERKQPSMSLLNKYAHSNVTLYCKMLLMFNLTVCHKLFHRNFIWINLWKYVSFKRGN
jgi:hypothetical protein